MALIAMAVWDTTDNVRTDFTIRTLDSLLRQVDWSAHRIIVVDNGSCRETRDYLASLKGPHIQILRLEENIGTANAINLAWRTRGRHESAVKMDNDVVIHEAGWLDLLCEAQRRDPSLGIVGLKRKDLAECPTSDVPFYRSTLRMLPHEPGQRWLIVEEVLHVMGTCQLYSAKLLNEIGYLTQPGLYGFDDALASLRAHVAGFKTVFLHGVEIDHIDPGGTAYTEWKQKYAGHTMAAYHALAEEYRSKVRPVYYAGGVMPPVAPRDAPRGI